MNNCLLGGDVHTDIKRMKKQLGVTDRELANILNTRSNSVTRKLNGFEILTAEERTKILSFLNSIENRYRNNQPVHMTQNSKTGGKNGPGNNIN